ncbi:MAG: spore germination protein GerW family protein [Nitrososphaerales archaeon]
MSTVEQDVKTTVDELLKAISTKNVIAEPIEVGDNVLITIARVGLGFGTGAGEGKGDKGIAGSGRGAGGVAGVSPVAVIVVHKSMKGPEGVEVKLLSPLSSVGKAIGEIATTMMDHLGPSKTKTEKTE